MAIFHITILGVDESLIDFRTSNIDVQLGDTDIKISQLQIDENSI